MSKSLLLFVFVFSCFSVSKNPPKLRDHFQQEATAVRVDVLCVGNDPWESDDGKFGIGIKTGSGVAVSSRHVLTALHVVACPFLPSVHVTFNDGRVYTMVVEREDKTLDIARLVLASEEHWDVDRPVVAGAIPNESVCTAAVQPKREWHCGTVMLAATQGGSNIIHTARTIKGNSGAGAYDSKGRLLGIVVEQIVAGQPDFGGRATSIAGRNLVP